MNEQTIKLPIIEGREIRFSRLSAAQGLSQVRVSNIIQDDRGFMWFGTQDGLNRYDGYKFKVFRHDNAHPDSLSGVYIYSLFKDRSGTIWVGSDQYLDRFDALTETFTHYRIDAQNSSGSATAINQISQDDSGMLWLSTGSGLYKLDPTSGLISHYRHVPTDPSSLGDNDIKTTGEDRAGTFWVGTGRTLDEFDRISGKVKRHIPLGDSGMGTYFHEDRFGVFWIIYGEDGVIATFDRKTSTLTRYELTPESGAGKVRNPAYTMLEDHQGTMWFGTGATGLLRFDRERRQFISNNNRPGDSESLADTRVITLFEDSEENIWAGLHQAEPNFFESKSPPFESFTHGTGTHNGLGGALIGALYEDRQGVLWVATESLVKRIVRKTGRSSTFRQLRNYEVLSIIEEGSDTLWFGTGGQGLMRYNRRTGRIRTYRHDPTDSTSLCSDLIERLLIDHRGNLWAATWDGLCRFDPTNQHFITYKPDLNTRGLNYYAIAEAENGSLWLGSNLGLLSFDPGSGRFKIYHHNLDDPQSLSDNRVNAVFFDHLGQMWIGTQNGLDKFNPEIHTFAAYGERQGMAGNVVSCILEDTRGRLWESTNKGVSSFDPPTEQFNNYTTADGLPGPDLTGWGACYKSAAGEMFFGGFSGAAAFYPSRVRDTVQVPNIVLTDFRLAGAEVPIGNKSPLKESITDTNYITLTSRQNIFSFEFSALSYFNSETTRYRYKLEGLDIKWNEVDSTQRIASYTTLPKGDYTLRVQSASSRGPWNEPGVSLHVHILPPWWDTWWFRTTYVASITLCLWFGYRFRLQEVTRQHNLRLQERLRERSRIARELHDTLLQGFQGLMLQFQNVLNTLQHDEPIYRRIEHVLGRADDVLLEGRQSISGLRDEGRNEGDLSELLMHYGEQLAEDHTVPFSFFLIGEARHIDPAMLREIYCIGREAIRNAFQHSRAAKIEAELSYERTVVTLTVRDNGIGIEPQVLAAGLNGHWGVSGMRERAEAIGGQLSVWSGLGSGTEITLTAPLSAIDSPFKWESLWRRIGVLGRKV
ncbi:ligand-binding sensor domain-containing protein [Acidisarcina polymorpha]|uniref:ligand-binding sensor domain-containing protein n=1 Tax=Acidisarcina polymorpha TaxID=2211140 RepID=UPI001F02496D|nr:sensor histidine kinase [Acidisarcina polymorpha]